MILFNHYVFFLPQMNGYIKYFDNVGKNMSFVTDDEKVYDKYNEIWEVIRKLLKVKFTVNPVRNDRYLVAKLKIFNKVNRTTFYLNFIDNEIIDDEVSDIDDCEITIKERQKNN